MGLYREITRFQKLQLKSEAEAKKKEKIQVNINPNSLIGREIKYQTALLHEILGEARKQTMMMESKRKKKREKISRSKSFEENTYWVRRH